MGFKPGTKRKGCRVQWRSGSGVIRSEERRPAQMASVHDITENTQVSWNVISSQWSVLQARKMNLAFPHSQTRLGSTMVQLQRLRESRAATAKMNEPPNQQVQSKSCHVPRNKPLRDVDWLTQINPHWATLTASHRRDFLLSVHLSYVVTGRRPWGAIIQVHRRLNIFPCCSEVHKHVLPKLKAMMQSHQLVT